jgi:hypothetical protein
MFPSLLEKEERNCDLLNDSPKKISNIRYGMFRPFEPKDRNDIRTKAIVACLSFIAGSFLGRILILAAHLS